MRLTKREPTSPMNQMSVGVLDLIGGFAALCQRNGYFSTLSAPESYLDPFSNSFDRSLTHTYPKWAQIGVDFSYHGRNCLAYVLAAYGGAMDLVSFQLYETYSHADFAVNVRGLDAGPYLARYVDALSRGWLVDFTQDHALAAADRFGGLGSGLRTVGVARSKIVLGLANAWGGRGDPVRALYLSPHQLLLAHRLAPLAASLCERDSRNVVTRAAAFRSRGSCLRAWCTHTILPASDNPGSGQCAHI